MGYKSAQQGYLIAKVKRGKENKYNLMFHFFLVTKGLSKISEHFFERK
jgi:hypothetical protein